jgi:predicted O-methyltransferase YrrM
MDHNPSWNSFVKEILEKASVQNAICYLEPLTSYKYYDTISEYEPFDCILVDGRNRIRCMSSAVKRVKPGGVIILDNAERPQYGAVFSILKEAKEYHQTTNGVWRTDYWIL